MQARDARQQTAWYAVPEGSIKKGFNVLTFSSSLLLIRMIGDVRFNRRYRATDHQYLRRAEWTARCLQSRLIEKELS
jgi:hypothetical protein